MQLKPEARTVRCPACGGASRFAADNPWRPFCSERCRTVDLGAWASERYRVSSGGPAEGAATDGLDGEASPAAARPAGPSALH